VQLQNQLFKYQNHILSYLQIGSGENLILAFHGFGMDRNAFSDFHGLVREDQKLVSVDLFSHGESQAKDFSGISRAEWEELMCAFLIHLGHDSFSMLAYSLGGKIVLETVNLFPEKIERLLLFAPDGFKRVRFYEFLSLSAVGRWTYRGVLRRPELMLSFVDFLTRIKLLPLRLNKFVHYHVGDKTRREQVYDVYRVYRHFIPDLNALQRQIESNQIKITLIYGRHDRVIHHSLGERFKEKLSKKELITIHLLNKGHVILDQETAAYVNENNLWFG